MLHSVGLRAPPQCPSCVHAVFICVIWCQFYASHVFPIDSCPPPAWVCMIYNHIITSENFLWPSVPNTYISLSFRVPPYLICLPPCVLTLERTHPRPIWGHSWSSVLTLHPCTLNLYFLRILRILHYALISVLACVFGVFACVFWGVGAWLRSDTTPKQVHYFIYTFLNDIERFFLILVNFRTWLGG